MADYKCVLKGTLQDGSDWLNVFYFSNINNSDTEVIAAVNAFLGEYCNLLRNAMTTNTHFLDGTIFKWDGTGWAQINYDNFAAAGTVSGDAAPNQVAPVLLAHTNIRRCRAKKCAPAPPMSMLTDGDLGTALLAILANVLALWLEPYVHGTTTIMPGAWRKLTHTIVTFVGGVVDSIPGTMRTRKTGRGI